MDELVAEFPEVSPFGDVLADEFVHVLNTALLPGGVAVREVNRGFQSLRYFPVGTELEPVVRGYRQNVLPVRIEQPDDGIRDLLVIHAVRKPLHYQVVPAPLAQGQYRTFLTFPYYRVHLPVPEPPAVRFCRPLMNAHPLRYVRRNRRTPPLLVSPVLHPVTAMTLQLSAFIVPDHLIYPLVRYPDALLLQPSRYLLR